MSTTVPRPPKPNALTVVFGGIPNALKELSLWVVWRYTWRESKGKWDKPPFCARNPHLHARVDDPNTWATFEEARAAYEAGGVDGVGIVLIEDDDLVGLDFDGCIDQETGELNSDASAIIDTMDSYTTLSPSGTGVRILARGTLPPGGRKKSAWEMYDKGRYLTLTGQVIGPERGIEHRQARLEDVHRRIFGGHFRVEKREFHAARALDVHRDDARLLERMFVNKKNGAEIRRLWEGDASAYSDDASAADLALVSHLAWWCDYDLARVDNLFRRSGLMRSKWDKKHSSDGRTYGQITLATASKEKGPGDGYRKGDERVEVGRVVEDDAADVESGAWVATPWPTFHEAAYHGLAGEVTRTIAPHSEADEAAILFQFLGAFGAEAGRNAHILIEADKHYPNLNIAVVGNSAKGRKGTSWGHIRRIMAIADPTWSARVVSGLSSGEGLIWAVRDPFVKKEPVKEKSKITGYQEVIADEGVTDKRLLVQEGELAQALKVMAREGNTLSTVVRNAWDTGSLRTLTKNNPTVATDAHIGIIGHITKRELLRYLNATEMANGFANRFLFVCVRRSKELPFGGSIGQEVLEHFAREVKDALTVAQGSCRVTFDDEAKVDWIAIYSKLSEAQPGLYGSLVARSEAQVLRLALIYALLDGSQVITRAHLEAALACWDYCEASVKYLFGESLGDGIADTILKALKARADKGMTRTEISTLFKQHAKGPEIEQALRLLFDANLAVPSTKKTAGRPKEVWHAKS